MPITLDLVEGDILIERAPGVNLKRRRFDVEHQNFYKSSASLRSIYVFVSSSWPLWP